MIAERSIALIEDLRQLPAETAWVEFKANNIDPEMVGARVSALSNSARLYDKHNAYIIWGIEDKTHKVVGTVFEPSQKVVKGQPYEFWLAQHLKPSVHLQFHIVSHPQGRLVLLEIPAATIAPIEFDRAAYIRIGSSTPRLAEHYDKQRALWSKLQPFAWEGGAAHEFATGDEVLSLLDYPSYSEMTKQPLHDNRSGIFTKLCADNIIIRDVGGRFNISNLGSVLFAKRFDTFGKITRKAIRVLVYAGTNRSSQVTQRQEGQQGYASGFEGLLTFINGLIPKNEHIGMALRTEQPMYPEIAIRELVANALIHQDMTITGAGPMVEIFSDRIEITNPGKPLIEPDRLIDMPPRSRNEALASLMRRMRICEEQGTGVDKVITAVELFQLPPPDFRVDGDNFKVVIFAPRSFADMTAAERVRACYQHSVLRFLAGGKLTNASLRTRLGIAGQNAAQVSRIINEAREAKLIRLADPEAPRAGYLPLWA